MTIHVATVAILLFVVNSSGGLLCYNCSTTNQGDWSRCAGDFVSSMSPFNSTKKRLVNCSGENPMCFVRSWSARARHAWIVQRGCYQPVENNDLLTSLSVPMRAMTCKRERLPDAEYKVCLCQADWCNSASRVVPCIVHCLNNYFRYTKQYIHTLYMHMLRLFK